MHSEEQTSWQIVQLNEQHKRETFDCGVESLNTFIRTHVVRNTDQYYGQTFVAERLPITEERPVSGYYTVSMASISFKSIPDKISRGLPKYPVPAALIARLATDKSARGVGLGGMLLIHALQAIHRLASSEIGCAAAIVDTENEEAKQFYLNYGFTPFEDKRSSLFLMTKKIKALF